MRPYSEQILLALDKHTRLNSRQLAGMISHEVGKTKDLVNYMRQNGKVVPNGMIDDLTSYSLSGKGRAEAARLNNLNSDAASLVHRRTEAPVGAPSASLADEPAPARKTRRVARASAEPNSLEDVMHDVTTRAPAVMAAEIGRNGSARLATTPNPNGPINARFGLLNTGELIIMPDQRAALVLSAEVAQGLREALAGAPRA